MQLDRKDWVPDPEEKVSVPEIPPDVQALIGNPDGVSLPTIKVQAGILPATGNGL